MMPFPPQPPYGMQVGLPSSQPPVVSAPGLTGPSSPTSEINLLDVDGPSQQELQQLPSPMTPTHSVERKEEETQTDADIDALVENEKLRHQVQQAVYLCERDILHMEAQITERDQVIQCMATETTIFAHIFSTEITTLKATIQDQHQQILTLQQQLQTEKLERLAIIDGQKTTENHLLELREELSASKEEQLDQLHELQELEAARDHLERELLLTHRLYVDCATHNQQLEVKVSEKEQDLLTQQQQNQSQLTQQDALHSTEIQYLKSHYTSLIHQQDNALRDLLQYQYTQAPEQQEHSADAFLVGGEASFSSRVTGTRASGTAGVDGTHLAQQPWMSSTIDDAVVPASPTSTSDICHPTREPSSAARSEQLSRAKMVWKRLRRSRTSSYRDTLSSLSDSVPSAVTPPCILRD